MTRALISADNHVFEPVTLWQDRLRADFRARGPRLERRDEWLVMVIEGMPDRKLTRVNGAPGTGEVEKSHELGLAAGGADPDARLKDMALDGVTAEVIYPTFGLFIDMIPAADLQMACAQVYNDWLAETFLHRPDVFIPSAIVPVRAVAAAAAELERVVELGFRAATIPTTPPVGMPYNDHSFDPLWKVAAEARVPLSLHTGTGALPQHERGPGGAVINYVKVGLLSAETLSYFAASGVLERFPDLRVVFVETGAGWLAYCCERMDEAFEEHAQWVNPKLELRPSEYVRRQCFVTLGADRAPLLTREITGVGPLLWASDYPHPEGTFPESQQVVERIFAGVPDADVNAIVHDNAARLYRRGIDVTVVAGANTLKDKTAVVGVGSTPYYKRGESMPQTAMQLAGKAVIAALDDAGLTVDDLDGFALYSMGFDTSLFAQWLGVPDVKFTAMLTGGGGGAAGSVGLASAAIVSGMAECVVSVMTLQQAASRFGASYAPRGSASSATYSAPPSPEGNFLQPSGLMAPGQMFAVLAQRHMHRYGTTREHFCEVALSTRANAVRRSTSLMQEPLTREQYFAARMISDPLCLYDFCLECDGAVAVVTTSAERARDLRHPPAYVLASAHGGHGRWGQAITWMGMPDDEFASSGHRPVARRLYEMADIGPAAVDVALLYDHFTPMVVMQLEDYGFCGIGEGGPFVADGNIRWPDGGLPVNTHGGNLSEAYIIGMTHVKEAVEQLRGTAVNQVAGAEVALVTGGPASLPVSSLLLHN